MTMPLRVLCCCAALRCGTQQALEALRAEDASHHLPALLAALNGRVAAGDEADGEGGAPGVAARAAAAATSAREAHGYAPAPPPLRAAGGRFADVAAPGEPLYYGFRLSESVPQPLDARASTAAEARAARPQHAPQHAPQQPQRRRTPSPPQRPLMSLRDWAAAGASAPAASTAQPLPLHASPQPSPSSHDNHHQHASVAAAAPSRRPVSLASAVAWRLLNALVGGVAGDVRAQHNWYDARGRVALRRVARRLRLPWRTVARMESALGAHLRAAADAAAALTARAKAAASLPHSASSSALAPLPRELAAAALPRGVARGKLSARQAAAVAGAALLGGGLFALTAGLAAPAIAAGAAAALSAGGGAAAAAAATAAAGSTAAAAATAAAAGTLGGAATARRMHTRVAGLSDFAFVPIRPPRRGDGDAEDARADADADEEEDADVAERPPKLAVTLCISGWLDTRADVAGPWAPVVAATSSVGPSCDAAALRWESDTLLALGVALRAFLKQQLVQRALTQGITQTALSGLLAALAAPMALNSAAAVIDNAWSVALAKADKAALALADVLASREWAAGRPVTLLAYSMGARVAFGALRELARRGCRGVVECAVLIGAPVPAGAAEWAEARAAVAGRLVNVYSANDLVLGVLYRAGHLAAPAGLRPVGVAIGTTDDGSSSATSEQRCVCVEDVNFSAVVAGHTAYPGAVPELLALLGLTHEDEAAA
jgi:hypothetical protein